ncbi:MAG: DUF4436 family protein [Thiobacillus sp.]|uniref:DUF4436 family protein n=1 Tax=Thiobacillus sp. TaxID=924 RepID=UPI0027334399|nr:DUF4436 family protein [Thiobacillus sp.]MDP3584752.1 DUF4436 family protein [Thiobacillus sp.]
MDKLSTRESVPAKKPVGANRAATKKLASALRILTIPLVMVFYLAVLVYNLHESDRRSLTLKQDSPAADAVHVSLKIVNLDVARGEITARMRIRLTGKIAKDEFTPAVNVRFLVNAFQGPQRFDLERGERVSPLTVVFPLVGEPSLYPFDTHEAILAFVATKPGQVAPPPPAPPPASEKPTSLFERLKKAGERETGETPPSQVKLVGKSELASRTQLPVSFDLSASIPGFKFDGEVIETGQEQVTGIQLKLRRANNVIVASLGIQLMMILLALSMLAMVLFGTMKGKGSAIDPLYIAPVLIFGLPALRDTQPGVPPLGAFSDYLSYLWAEAIVAGCTIIAIWTWIARHRSDNEPPAPDLETSNGKKTPPGT